LGIGEIGESIKEELLSKSGFHGASEFFGMDISVSIEGIKELGAIAYLKLLQYETHQGSGLVIGEFGHKFRFSIVLGILYGLHDECGQPEGVFQRIKGAQLILAGRSQDTGDEYIQKVLICMDHLRVRVGIKINGKLIYDQKVASGYGAIYASGEPFRELFDEDS
jgi:hypothetical protein